MNFFKKLASTIALCLIWGHAVAKAERYDFQIPSFKTPAEDTPKSKYVGELTFKNGTHIAAYNLTLVSGIEESGWVTPEIGSLKIDSSFNADSAKRLDAYAHPNGWIIVPKGWKPVAAGSGANGSVSLLFSPDQSGEMYLTYHSSGACVGCAQSSASLFFPNAKLSAKNNDFSYYDRTNVKSLKTVNLRPNYVAYSYRFDQGNLVNGLAIYDENNEGSIYQNIVIRIPDQDLRIASVILNRYVPQKRH